MSHPGVTFSLLQNARRICAERIPNSMTGCLPRSIPSAPSRSSSQSLHTRTALPARCLHTRTARHYHGITTPNHPNAHTTSSTLRTKVSGNSARKGFHSSTARQHGDITRPAPGTGIKVHFKDSKGTLIKTIEANEGDDILSIAHEHDIDLEGACEGSIACSTCHVVLSPEHYDLLPEPEDDENDMLDMAFALTDTSRLGCQVKLTRELDGMTATLPSATRNMFVDGKKPTHH